MRAFKFDDGIPILLLAADGAKSEQVEYFDKEANAEFEITRPHGAPALYGWLLTEKFRRSVSALAPALSGSTALSVCAGSGMDAEFLARAGARVIAADISLGAARRASARARRHGIEITPIVADAERLPFGDRSIDLVYVHDGLHHVERPAVAIAEMARVAHSAVCISEPARAAVTAGAIRLGLAFEREEAGNVVRRLTLEDIRSVLTQAGFRIVAAERYGMFYRHEPGWAMRFLSRSPLLELSQGAFRLGNLVAGSLGNKLTVQAVRGDTR